MKHLPSIARVFALLVPSLYFGATAFFYLSTRDAMVGMLALTYGGAAFSLASRASWGKYAAALAAFVGIAVFAMSGIPLLHPLMIGIIATNGLAALSAWKSSSATAIDVNQMKVGGAVLGLSFYFGVYGMLFVLALLEAFPWELGRYAGGMALCYGIAIGAFATRAFWARWFGLGTALYGVVVGTLGMVLQPEVREIAIFILLTHGIPAVMLLGRGMEKLFEGQEQWRERFSMDAASSSQLKKAVTRAGVFLPFTIGYALAPRQDEAGFTMLLLLALTGTGVLGLLRNRTWGLVSLAGASVLAIGSAFMVTPQCAALSGPGWNASSLWSVSFAASGVSCPTFGITLAIFIASAVVPFAAPMWNYLRR